MLVLTGTSGGLGSAALDTILSNNLTPPSKIRISSATGITNNPSALAAGIEVRRGDITDPSTLPHAFSGADALFLVSYPSVGFERYEYHRNAIDAAKAAGIKHVIYTSLSWGGPEGLESKAGVLQAHLRTVEYLKQSGLIWTVVRYATYNHLWTNVAGFLRLEDPAGEVVVACDGVNHFASRRELGEATARILAAYENYANQTLTLTGPELLTVRQIVDKYNAYSGRQVIVRVVGEEAAVEYHKQHHTLPPEQEAFLPNWASWSAAIADGEADYLTTTLEELLGRRPSTFDDMAEELFEAEKNQLDTKDFN